MKKRILSILLVLVMMLSLIPGMVFTTSAAEEFSEVIAFTYGSTTAESEHFTLTADEFMSDGWCAQSDISSIVIEAKNENFFITAIEAYVTAYGSNYAEAVYSSGEKAETGEVANGSTVHVNNINTNRLEINSKSSSCIALRNITVHYKICDHEVIAFTYGSTTAESEHFALTADEFMSDGWCAQSDIASIVIEAKNENFFITAIEAYITAYGSNYAEAVYSSGEKVETDEVANGTTVHVINIDTNRLEINSRSSSCIALRNIKVYYDHNHDFSGESRDNGDGTHSFKCTLCDKYGNTGRHTLTAPDCTVPVFCLICHEQIGPALGHDFPDTWEQYNAEQHMRTCNRCGDIDYEDHNFVGNTCSDCGYVKAFTYSMISEWTKGSTAGLTVISNAPIENFDCVKVDDEVIDAADYTAEGDFTRVTLTPTYLETLGVGMHSLEIVSADGSAFSGIVVKASAQPPVPVTYTVTFNMNSHGEQVEAQTVESGNKAAKPAEPSAEGYNFGGWFADAAFSVEFNFDSAITAETTVYAKWTEVKKDDSTDPTDPAEVIPVTYSIISGANGEWTKGSTNGLTVRSDAPFAKFVGVKVDGKTIAATNYTAKEGSTIVTLTPAYLETLEVGTHSLEIVSSDGSASTNFTVKANSQTADSTDPQTGDNSMIYLWSLILVVSVAGLSATAIYSRKRKHN